MMKTLIALSGLGLLVAWQVVAQDYGQDEARPDWNVTLGAAAISLPKFEGSDRYEVKVLPNIQADWKDTVTFSMPEGLKWNVVNRDGFKAGPVVKYKGGREESDDRAALRGMGEVDSTAEVGGFAKYRMGQFEGKVEARQALGGHEGAVVDAGVNMFVTSVPQWFFSAGPRLTWASEDYNQAYFGVDAGQAARSGYARYTADSGLKSVGVGGVASYMIDKNWSLTGFANYDRLQDVATDSPLIDRNGDANQVMVGVAVGYRFGF